MVDNDSLLAALGRIAREQRTEPLPDNIGRGLVTPEGESEATKVALSALAGSGEGSRATTDVSAGTQRVFPAIARRRLLRSLWIPLVATPCLAAIVAFWVSRSSLRQLPVYALEVRGGIAETRASAVRESKESVVLDGQILEVVVRPEHGTAAPVAVRPYWLKDGRLHPWRVETEFRNGSFRLRGPAEAPTGSGSGELVVVVGHRSELPPVNAADPDLIAGSSNLQVLRQPVIWR